MLLSLVALSAAIGADKTTFEGHPAFLLSNGKIELTVLQEGGAMARITLKDDPSGLNPLWEPARMARELGQKSSFSPGTGHFLCVDGFGGTSPQERAAGLPGHGEAHLQSLEVQEGGGAGLTLSAQLPAVQEKVTRNFMLANDAVYVHTTVESLLGFDRPIQWAEHATIGSPFLQPGVTVVNMSGHRAKTRPYAAQTGGLPHRLTSGQDFTWPMAPSLDGSVINMTQTPANPNSGDHTACLMDTGQEFAWIAAFNPQKKLLLGYLFRREDFPWVQTWEFYPPTQKMARGMEFSTQPFDVPRREVVTQNTLFDTPLYRWLPAKSKIESSFLMFYTHVPDGFSQVDDVRMEGDNIVVEDRAKNLKHVLRARRP